MGILVVIVILLLILGLISVYVLPSVIAFRKEHANVAVILVVNCLFGFTFIAWIATLIWALTNSKCKRTNKEIIGPIIATYLAIGVFCFVVPGVLFLVGCVKIGEAAAQQAPPAIQTTQPLSDEEILKAGKEYGYDKLPTSKKPYQGSHHQRILTSKDLEKMSDKQLKAYFKNLSDEEILKLLGPYYGPHSPPNRILSALSDAQLLKYTYARQP